MLRGERVDHFVACMSCGWGFDQRRESIIDRRHVNAVQRYSGFLQWESFSWSIVILVHAELWMEYKVIVIPLFDKIFDVMLSTVNFHLRPLFTLWSRHVLSEIASWISRVFAKTNICLSNSIGPVSFIVRWRFRTPDHLHQRFATKRIPSAKPVRFRKTREPPEIWKGFRVVPQRWFRWTGVWDLGLTVSHTGPIRNLQKHICFRQH